MGGRSESGEGGTEIRGDAGTDLARRGAVWALYLSALAPLVFSSRTIYPYVIPRAFWFRAWVALAAAVALYLLATRARASDPSTSARTSPRDEPRSSDGPVSEPRGPRWWRDPVLLALGALVAIQLVAALAGEAPLRSLLGDMERMGGVLAWMHFLAFYVALRALLTDRELTTFLYVLMLVATVVSGVAILQSLGVTIGILPGTGSARAIGTIGNAGYLAIYVLLGGVIAAIAGIRSRSLAWRAASAVAVATNGAVLVLTFTRAALAALAVGLLVGAVSYGVMAGSGRRRRWALAGAAGLVVLAGVAAWGVWGRGEEEGIRGVERLTNVSLLERSLGYRFSAWRAGARAVADDPLTGLGPENFRLAFDWHFDPERFPPQVHYTRAHNDLVEFLVAGGVPGGLAWIALWGALFYVLVRARRERRLAAAEAALLGGAFTAYLVYLLFWFHEQNSLPLFLALAAYLGLRRRGRYLAPSAQARARRPVGARLVIGSVLAALVIADVAHHGRVLAAGRHLLRAAEGPELQTRVVEYQRALELRPPGADEAATEFVRFASQLPGALGEALQNPRTRTGLTGFLDRGRRALASEIADDPSNPRLYREAGRLHLIAYQVSRRKADLDSAAATLERAVELAPDRLRIRHMLSEVYLIASRPDEAVRVLEEGLARYDGLGETHYFLAKALIVGEAAPEAAEALIRAYERGYRRRTTQPVRVAILRELRARGLREEASRLWNVWRNR